MPLVLQLSSLWRIGSCVAGKAKLGHLLLFRALGKPGTANLLGAVRRVRLDIASGTTDFGRLASIDCHTGASPPSQ